MESTYTYAQMRTKAEEFVRAYGLNASSAESLYGRARQVMPTNQGVLALENIAETLLRLQKIDPKTEKRIRGAGSVRDPRHSAARKAQSRPNRIDLE